MRRSIPSRGAVGAGAIEAPPKRPLEIGRVLAAVEQAVRPYPKAALFELADQGYSSVFHQLVACIISIRTLDEVTLVTARRLFAHAPTPQAIADLAPEEIDRLIRTCTFHEPKSATIHAIARRILEEFGGVLPCDKKVLTSFRGVGTKCAHLTLAVACKEPKVAVDVHVHRITNRWGYVHTATPEQTTEVLEEKLPPQHKIAINRLLVPFGKHICTGRLPRCSTCPVEPMCRQVGVTAHR